jgi:pimeloyl-ACP methyl ester carboxylesterase
MLLRDGSIFARSWGPAAGSTVLCWHGAGGSSADFEHIAPGLADRLGVRVVAVDGPGHAQSSAGSPDEFRPSELASLAADILDELDAARAVFVGFSWGAAVGCWFAALYPERTLALVLVEGGHLDFADVPGFRTDRSLDEFVREAEAVAAGDGPDFGSYTPATAGAMVHGLCNEPAGATYGRLAASEIPVLFLGARTDGPSAGLERLARLVPQSEIVQLDTPSHELLRDAPSEVARETGAWLAERSPTSPA